MRGILLILVCGFITALQLFTPLISMGQRGCATDQFNRKFSKPSFSESPQVFEEWLIKKKNHQARTFSTLAAGPRTIPVVFHVIHNSTLTLSALKDEKLIEQIQILNQDFSRQNPDKNDTDPDWIGVASNDSNIRFELAKRDPIGRYTNGITHHAGPSKKYSLDDGYEIASIVSWPTDQYLNIWICDFDKDFRDDQILGFAQYPQSDQEGLLPSHIPDNFNHKTDGVFIYYKFVGNNDIGTKTSKGRTATHEVGHWLGLRHIFDGCGNGDYVDDTPDQSIATVKCPTAAILDANCGNKVMFQNYMDYTNDECMNLMTIDQAARMNSILDFSPRRQALFSSEALDLPVDYDFDLGLVNIVNPVFGNITSSLTPAVEVQNWQETIIEDFEIEFLIDDEVIETLEIESTTPSPVGFVPLDSGDIYRVSFSNYDFPSATSKVSFRLVAVNGFTMDENDENDQISKTVRFPQRTSLPLIEDFQDFGTSSWTMRNPNGTSSDASIVNASDPNPANKAIKLSYYNSVNEGQQDYILSPLLDLSDIKSCDLSFDYTYSMITGRQTDALYIVVSTDGGNTFPPNNIIWGRWSSDLASTPPNNSDFEPIGAGDWDKVENVSLSAFLGSETIVVAFISNNGSGNNIYIDNIAIDIEFFDQNVSIKSIGNISPSSCAPSLLAHVKIENSGNEVNWLDLKVKTEEKTYDIELRDIMWTNRSITVPVQIQTSLKKPQKIEFELSGPNGLEDEFPSDNYDSIFYAYNPESDIIPLLVNFTNTSSYSKWTMMRQDQRTDLSVFQQPDYSDKHLKVSYFSTSKSSTENFFISPSLDFSDLDSASMRFDLSYAYRSGDDRLQVLVSTDCGVTYKDVVFDKKDRTLSVNNGQVLSEWIPADDNDWRSESIGLSKYVGNSDVRVAFKFTGQLDGNNIYVDNVEFFDTATPPKKIGSPILAYPNPAKDYFNIQLKFNTRDDITIAIVSLTGQVMAKRKFPNSLNQTYTFNNIDIVPGLYVVYIYGKYSKFKTKVAFVD